MPETEALAELMMLRGVGPWAASHIYFRGAAPPDALPTVEPRVLHGIASAYGVAPPSVAAVSHVGLHSALAAPRARRRVARARARPGARRGRQRSRTPGGFQGAVSGGSGSCRGGTMDPARPHDRHPRQGAFVRTASVDRSGTPARQVREIRP
jgi:hypothetical protein